MYSINTATGTGGQITVPVPPYISKDHIAVYVDFIPTTAFEWINDQTISVIAPLNRLVKVVRNTSQDARLTRYLNGEALPGETLEIDSKQAFFMAQEAYDMALQATGSNGAVTVGGIVLSQQGVKDLLAGQITPSMLENQLREDIALTAAPASTPGSILWNLLQEANARAAALAAEAAARDGAVAAEANARVAAVLAERTERITATDALASRVDSVVAGTAGLNAAVVAEYTARVSDIAAVTDATTTLGSTLGGRIGAVETTAGTLVTSMGKVESNYTIKVQARSDGKSAIAGIGLTATSATDAPTQSEMILMADKFTFVPSQADLDATPQPLLVMGVVSGVNTLVVPKQRLGDQLVEARMIVDGTITATQVAANSITADRIDARGLSIKDAAGNVIVSAGASVAASTLNLPGTVNNAPAGWLNSNLQVGGRNLLQGTRALTVFESGGGNFTTTAGVASSVSTGVEHWKVLNFADGVAGTTYTASVWAQSTSLDKGITLPVYVNGAWTHYTYMAVNAGVFTQFSYTFTCTVSGPIKVSLDNYKNVTGTLSLKWPQLEMGNKATDWTPAPEDVLADSTTLSAAAQAAAITAAATDAATKAAAAQAAATTAAAADATSKANLAATTANWAGVSGTGKPANNATANQADSVTNAAISTAATTATWSGVGTKPANLASLTGSEAILNSSITAASIGAAATADLVNKLSKTGADTLVGPVSLTAANSILVGNTTDGLYLGSTGIVGRKAGVTTFSVDQAGNASFKGDITGASGTFAGNLRGGQFSAGNMSGWAWPTDGALGGVVVHPNGILLGNQNLNKYFYVDMNGEIAMPGLRVSGGVLTVSQASVINTLNIAGNAVTIPASAGTAGITNVQPTLATVLSFYIDAGGAPIWIHADGIAGTQVWGGAGTPTGTVIYTIYVDGSPMIASAVAGNVSISTQISGGGNRLIELRAQVQLTSGYGSIGNIMAPAGISLFAIGTKR